MAKGISAIVVVWLAAVARCPASIPLDASDARGVSRIQSHNQNQLYLQSADPVTGSNILMGKGNKYVIDRDPAAGLPDWYPVSPPNFATGVTPMHLTYQYLTRPQTITTPFNQFAFPRVHVPIYGLEHPMNMHHPFNNIFGMHPHMFTGAASTTPSFFMNPAAYGKKLMAAPVAMAPGIAAATPAGQPPVMGGVPAGPMAMPTGFNPTAAGIGPFGAGGSAFNPTQTPMGPWFYLSPFNSGQ